MSGVDFMRGSTILQCLRLGCLSLAFRLLKALWVEGDYCNQALPFAWNQPFCPL